MVQKKSKINKHFKKNKSSKKSKFLLKYGGEDTMQLIKKMRAYSGEFVLVIGTNYSQPWCLEFANSKENIDKMVITLDLDMSEPTQLYNFKLDFNKMEIWNILHEFDDRFRTIIFDVGTIKWFDNEIDYVSHIKQLLIKNGNMYMFLLPEQIGDTFKIPSYIPKENLVRAITDNDIRIIKYQYPDIPYESIEKIGAITEIIFTKTPFGLIRGYNPDYEINYFITSIDSKGVDNKWELTNTLWRLKRDVIGNNLDIYINSLFLYYELLTKINILEKVYGFKTHSYQNCNEYPLKNPYNDAPNKRMLDYCFTVCTKQ